MHSNSILVRWSESVVRFFDTFETSRLPTSLSTRDLARPMEALSGLGSALLVSIFGVGVAVNSAGSRFVCWVGSTRHTIDFTIGAFRAIALSFPRFRGFMIAGMLSFVIASTRTIMSAPLCCGIPFADRSPLISASRCLIILMMTVPRWFILVRWVC